ncbi:MAG: hypothetical protein DMF49_06185, partial [Acidobacteria bacterium]
MGPAIRDRSPSGFRSGRPTGGGAFLPYQTESAQSETRSGETATLEGILERVVYSNEENGWSVVRLSAPARRELVT